MDLNLAPSWPPPRRWFLGLFVGALLAAVIPVIGLIAAGLGDTYPALIGLGLALLLVVIQVIGRIGASRKPRILRLPDSELTAVIKLIDAAAQHEDRGMVRQAQEYLALHRRISRRDAATAVGKLLRRDYPRLADKFGFLD